MGSGRTGTACFSIAQIEHAPGMSELRMVGDDRLELPTSSV